MSVTFTRSGSNATPVTANFGPWQRRVKLQLPLGITGGWAKHGHMFFFFGAGRHHRKTRVFEKVVTVCRGQTVFFFLSRCDFKNSNEAHKHQCLPPPRPARPPDGSKQHPQGTRGGSGRNEAEVRRAEVFRNGKVGPKLWPPLPSKRKDEGSRAELSRSAVSQTAHQCNFCPVPVSPARPRFLLAAPFAKDKRRVGGGVGVSLPSIWCCMPLSGCQPAHSNEGCHQGYCMLEQCLLLFGSLSSFILFVQDTSRIYTAATRQRSPLFLFFFFKRQLYH